MLEHDELDSLLNGIDWDRPLSPLDLDLPNRTRYHYPSFFLLSCLSSSLAESATNPLIDKFLQSLTNAPIQFIDQPATPRQESRVNILLPSLGGSKAQSAKTQSEGSRSNPSSPRRFRSDSTALGTTTQDARAFLSRLIGFSESSRFSTNRREKEFFGIAILLKGLDTTPFTLPAN